MLMDNEERVCNSIGMDEISFLFWRIVKIWRRSHDKLLADLGITGPQFEILAAIYHLSANENEVSQILISSHTLIDPMTTSTTLRNLQKKKLITRKSSKVDTRALVVEFTEEGSVLFEEAKRRLIKSKEKFHEYIDEKNLIEGMRKLLDVMVKLEEDNK